MGWVRGQQENQRGETASRALPSGSSGSRPGAEEEAAGAMGRPAGVSPGVSGRPGGRGERVRPQGSSGPCAARTSLSPGREVGPPRAGPASPSRAASRAADSLSKAGLLNLQASL